MITTGLYASLCALLIIKLSLRVVGLRRKHHVRLGDGGHDVLQTAIRVHGNAVEYIPIALILMLTLELSGANIGLIHLTGITLLTGRIIHAFALTENNIRRRVLGMKITLYLIMTLVTLNIGYFAYHCYLGLIN